jgi:hypothetical protein
MSAFQCPATTSRGQQCKRMLPAPGLCHSHAGSSCRQISNKCAHTGCKVRLPSNFEFCTLHEPDYISNYYKHQMATANAIMSGKVSITGNRDVDKIIATYLHDSARWIAR